MMAQPSHNARNLLANVLEIARDVKVRTAREHEIVPDHDAEFIAQVVKTIGFVQSPRPQAQHVHVRLLARAQEMFIVRHGQTILQRVGGNPVCAFAEDQMTINFESKRLVISFFQPSIHLTSHFNKLGLTLSTRLRL